MKIPFASYPLVASSQIESLRPMYLNPIDSEVRNFTLRHELAIRQTNSSVMNGVSCLGTYKGVANLLKVGSVQVYISKVVQVLTPDVQIGAPSCTMRLVG